MFALVLLAQTSENGSASPLASMAFAAGCGLLTMILLRRSYRHFGKRTRGGSGPAIDTQPRPTDPWAGVKRDAGARFDRQKVEMHELARDLMGQLESKTIVLNELVQQSQRQIDRLTELLDRGEKEPRMNTDERG